MSLKVKKKPGRISEKDFEKYNVIAHRKTIKNLKSGTIDIKVYDNGYVRSSIEYEPDETGHTCKHSSNFWIFDCVPATCAHLNCDSKSVFDSPWYIPISIKAENNFYNHGSQNKEVLTDKTERYSKRTNNTLKNRKVTNKSKDKYINYTKGQLWEIINKALNFLTKKEREAVEQVYYSNDYKNLGQKEAAENLGISQSSLNERLQSALKKIEAHVSIGNKRKNPKKFK